MEGNSGMTSEDRLYNKETPPPLLTAKTMAELCTAALTLWDRSSWRTQADLGGPAQRPATTTISRQHCQGNQSATLHTCQMIRWRKWRLPLPQHHLPPLPACPSPFVILCERLSTVGGPPQTTRPRLRKHGCHSDASGGQDKFVQGGAKCVSLAEALLEACVND